MNGLPYWLDLNRPTYPTFSGPLTADVVVIGAGIVGLKIAHYLGQQGLTAIILEGDRVGQGASGRNQGSINHGGAMNYAVGIERHGRQQARTIWQLGLENHRRLREHIEIFDIDCDYQVSGFNYLGLESMSDVETAMAVYRADYELLHEDGFAVEYVDSRTGRQSSGSPTCLGGLRYQSDAQFHAGKYVIGLARAISEQSNITLFEHSRVVSIEQIQSSTRVNTANGYIDCRAVALATNALAPQTVPHLEAGLRAERGQVFVTEPLTERPCEGSFAAGLGWWREIIEADGTFRLLFGGGRGRDEPDSLFPQFTATGEPLPQLETEGFSPSKAHQERLNEHFALSFPQLAGVRISHRWGGLQSFVADSLPQVGLFDEQRHIFGIAGLCGRGNCYSDVTAAYLAGLIADASSGLSANFDLIIEDLMAVDRPEAHWPPWNSLFR